LPCVTATSYRDNFDFPIRDYYRSLGFDFTREPYPDLAAEYMALYQPASFDCPLRSGALRTLQAFCDRGIPQVLLSATDQDFLGLQVRHFGLDKYFQTLLGLEDVLGHSKRERARRWFSSLGIQPQDVLLIGDTIHDAAVASDLACRCLLLDGGHNSRQRLEKTGWPVASGLVDWPALFDEMLT
jgi:phosphoglycolate phosphatase